jgi:ATP-dependent Clp endopeptidase proteolytic subunit ClpP
MPTKVFLKTNVSGTEIYIYNDVDAYWGFSANDLQNSLKDIAPDSPLTVYINSAGGEVFEGLAIYNTLRSWKGEVTTITMGIAASISSVIFLAGEKRQIVDNAMIMVHNPLYTHVSGNKDQLQEHIKLLEKTETTVSELYQSRLNASEEQVKEWMDGETFFTAQEALDAGFATELIEPPEIAASFDVHKLVAKLKGKTSNDKEPTKMNEFEKWLKDTLHLDPETMEDATKMALHSQFQAIQAKASNKPPKKDDDDRRIKDALELERQDGIQNAAIKLGNVKLNADYLKEDLGLKIKTVKGLQAHAVREGWTVDRFELELRRAEMQDHGHVGIHVSDPLTDIQPQVLSCALSRSAGVPMNAANIHNPDRKYGIEHWYPEKVLEASDDKRLKNFGLLQMLDFANIQATGSPFHGRKGSDEFIAATRDSLWKLRMGGNTTWGGLNIFDDAANKMLWAAYEAVNTTWQEWVDPVSVNDFKTNNIYRLTNKGGYLKVGADGELKHGGFTDDKYTVAADTFGKIVGLTRRDIINDDLSALSRIMSALGVEGARFLEELVYAYFMAQTTTLFPTAGTYNNYISGTGTVLGVDGLTAGEKAFRDQVDADGAPIMVEPAILLVGNTLAIPAAELFTNTQLQGVQTANAKKRPDGNPHVGKFRPVVSGYLDNTNIKQRTDALGELGDAIDNQSSTVWFLLANPGPMGAILTAAFLNGNQRPVIEQADQSFNVLGLQWRAYHDAGVGNGDPKMGVQSKGAA